MKILSTRKAVQLAAVLAALAVAVAMAVALVKSKPEPEKRESKNNGALVEVIPVRPEQVRMNVMGTGAVEARTQLELTSQVGGRIDSLSSALREGGAFRKGDQLLQIDQRRYRLAVDRAEAAVAKARIALEQLDVEKKNDEASLAIARKEAALYAKDYERNRRLVETRTGSESARDTAQARLLTAQQAVQTLENKLRLWPDRRKNAQAALEEAQTALDGAQVDLADTEIHAPFDGHSTALLVEQGQFISAGMPLARVYESGPMEITVRVPLDEFLWIDVSDLAGHPPRAQARLAVAGQNWAWTGSVVRADANMDQATRTAGLTVCLDATQTPEALAIPGSESPLPLSQAPRLVPGLFLDVEIEGRPVSGVFRIPLASVDQQGRAYIANGDNRLDVRPLRILATRGDVAYVTEGLKKDERLIVSPLVAPVDGMRLRMPDSQPGESKKRETPDETGVAD